ncbi:hypothetical protein [Ulvibacterium marinum]|uniref:hypothetical protein n=1 Tax=Ulvibacterium marinum TaxID=2419782 RepID=UPI0024953DE3|nr:hypothetical protein [Ulvibacterium marinum]
MKKHLKFLTVAIVIVFSIEFLLRAAFGFCDTVLFKESKNYEYIVQPNQVRHRFGRHVAYNSHSMRSEEIDSAAIKILCFGDSVINGGVLTDQDSLATTLLSTEVSQAFDKNVQFLNISAGSWGPDNCFAYLKENGNFSAKLILLFVNSHDAYDNMTFEKVVDVHRNYPSHQHLSAIYELWNRYLYPRLMKFTKDDNSSTDGLGINKKKKMSQFNPGFRNFIAYSKRQAIPLMVYLHAGKDELQQGSYNEQGQEIIKLLKNTNIPVLKDLNLGLEASDFRDGIHLNEKGQKNITGNIFNALKDRQFDFLVDRQKF